MLKMDRHVKSMANAQNDGFTFYKLQKTILCTSIARTQPERK